MKPGSLILVCMAEPHAQQFRRKRLDWPLHVTLLPWFTVENETTFLSKLGEYLQSVHSFEVNVGEDALFGLDADIPVSLIKQKVEMHQLHEALRTFAVTNRATLNETQWVGDSYRAHITHHSEHQIYQDDVFRVDVVTVVRLLADDICEVVKTIPLGSTNETAA